MWHTNSLSCERLCWKPCNRQVLKHFFSMGHCRRFAPKITFCGKCVLDCHLLHCVFSYELNVSDYVTIIIRRQTLLNTPYNRIRTLTLVYVTFSVANVTLKLTIAYQFPFNDTIFCLQFYALF